MDKPIYRMSGIGSCPRVLAAERLGYDPLPRPKGDEDRLKHYSRMEAVAAEQIADTGFVLELGGWCEKCQRSGIHVKVDTALFLLIGHLDRRLMLPPPLVTAGTELKYPVEIKGLGKASWTKFQQKQFAAFPEYAGQECAYLEAEGKPGIYWVMERDSGQALKYIVNDFNNELNLDGFEKITLPVTFSEIEDKLNQIEVVVQDNVLPDGVAGDGCWWCGYKYLCIKEEDKDKIAKVITDPSLVTAAGEYKYALELEKTAGEIKVASRNTLLAHSKKSGIEKFRVSGVSVSYRGQKTKWSLDQKLIQEKYAEAYKACLKESEPFDDYTIRRLKEG